jgi:phospholipid/cholesterol/gamma-HCH transport system substrate-binding protein
MKLKREYKIGIYAIIVLVTFILGVNFIKGRDIFRKHRKFYAVYTDIGGLVEASTITINGLNVGNVSDIHFTDDTSGNVLVELTLYKSIDVPKNSVARITSDLLGTKTIQLVLGDSKEIAKSGDTIIAQIQASLQEEVNRQVAPIKRKAEDLILSIDTLIVTVRAVFDKQARENLSLSFQHIRQTIANLEHTTYNLDTLVYGQRNRFERILFNIESITGNIRENGDKIDHVIANFEAISDTLARTNVKKTLDDVDVAILNFSAVMQKVNSGEGSLGMLVNDKKLYSSLENSSKELNFLIGDIKLNPHRYLNFSVFPPGAKRMQYSEPASK